MSYYIKDAHKSIKNHWAKVRNDIIDAETVSLGDEIVSNHRPTWNQFTMLFHILEYAPRHTARTDRECIHTPYTNIYPKTFLDFIKV